jgi:hypothetical protein
MLHRGDCAAGLGGITCSLFAREELTKPGRAGEGPDLGSANYKARLYLQRWPAMALSYVRQSQKAMKRRLPMAGRVSLRGRQKWADVVADGLDRVVGGVERSTRVEQLRGDLKGG